MKEKKILLLGASALQLAAIRKTKELGIECIAVDYDENAVGVKEVDKFYNISTIDYKRVLETAQKEEVDGIFTICSDRPMQIVAKVSSDLGLNAISCEAALLRHLCEMLYLIIMFLFRNTKYVKSFRILKMRLRSWVFRL